MLSNEVPLNSRVTASGPEVFINIWPNKNTIKETSRDIQMNSHCI